MNIKELIDKIESLPSLTSITSIRPYVDKKIVLGLISQLDEPEKVKVPQFVADWIEECKNDDFHLFGAMEAISLNQKKLDYWFREDDNMELFARAWLDGYEVEKEKRYIVKMKGIADSCCVLTHCKDNNRWIMGIVTNNHILTKTNTRKELEEAGFGWVFDCEGIEIEEVE